MPTNRVVTVVINVDNRIAMEISAAPSRIGIPLAGRSDVPPRYP